MSAGAQSDLTAVPASRPDGPSRSAQRPTNLALLPFRALRYTAGDLSALTSPPYDVIDADGVAALEAASEHNVVRLILPREDPGSGLDRYERAAQTLQRWRAEGVLAPDPAPALYVYEQAAPTGHVQRGLLGALALSPPEDGLVLPHENTMSGPVGDRLALYDAVDADLEPIFLVYDGGGAASRAVQDAEQRDPLVDEVLPDGLRHRLWSITEPDVLDAVATDLATRRALIADGHHRYATYLQRQAAHHDAGDGPGPWDTGLTFLVDAQAFGPEVHPIHRVVPGHTAADLAGLAARGFSVQDLHGDLDAALAALSATGVHGPAFLLASGDGSTLRLLTDPDPARLAAALPADRSEAWRALDVSVLHGYVVPQLWGLQDTVETVSYEHDVDAALAAAARTGGTAVLLNATPVDGVVAVAGGGERMPRKSTLFTPKPRTGLVLRDHRDA